jgi:hypothetical protein
MDSTYKEFIVPNGLTYPQKPDSLKVQAGLNKLRLTWLKAKDPSIVSAKIYWDNYTDSLSVDIANNLQGNIIVVDIDVLDENTRTFQVKTFDVDGNASIPAEISGTAYGDNYILSVTDRSIASALRDANYTGTVTWNTKTSDLVYSEVRYVTSAGETKIVRIQPDEILLRCPDIKPGELFEYRSVFLPPNGIDYVEKDWVTYEHPFYYMYPRNTWTAEARGGNHSWSDGGGGQPALILDGNMSTGWHSYASPPAPLPQCIVIDMKESLAVHHITVCPPTSASWCYLDDIEIYFSDTPITPDVVQPSWGEPVVKLKYPGPRGSSFTVDFPDIPSTQFVVIYFLTSLSNTYISFMEFEVYII